MTELQSLKKGSICHKQNYVGQMVKKLQKFEVEVLKISWEKAVFSIVFYAHPIIDISWL